jgi:hypothetical protein
VIVCRNCGHSNPEGTEFCENCKSFLEFTGEHVGSTSGTDTGGVGTGPGGTGGTSGGATPLGGGGTPLGGGGTPLGGGPGSGGTGPTGVTGPTGPGGGGPPDPHTIGLEPGQVRCPRCGTPNEANRVFCKFCGERLATTAAVVPTEPRPRFAVDSRVAIGAALVLLAIGAAAGFALVLSGQRPAATASPSSGASAAPSGTDTAAASVTPGASSDASAPPASSSAPSQPPSTTAAPSSAAPVVTPVPPSVTPTTAPPTPTPIAFYAVRNGQADIFTVPPSGGKIDNLTQDAPADSDPKWSPDGTRLAFDSRRVDGHRNVWVLEPDGITFTRLTEDTTSSNSLPSWSPDGAGITWVHDGEIWVMSLADRSRIQLTTGADDSRPSWSPSGLIVFGRTSPNG